MDVVISARAERDLVEIFNYLIERSPKGAESVISKLNENILALSSFSRRGAPRDDIGPNLRMLVVHSYTLIYAVRRDYVIVLRVLHGSRDLKREIVE